MSRRITLYPIIALCAGLLPVWRPFIDEGDNTAQQRSQIMKPDFTARGLETRLFESEGNLAHQLKADAMAHYLQIGLTELTQPVYSVYTEDNQPTWQISAEQGTL